MQDNQQEEIKKEEETVEHTTWIFPFQTFNSIKQKKPGAYNSPNRSGDYGVELEKKWKNKQRELCPKGVKCRMNKEVISVL